MSEPAPTRTPDAPGEPERVRNPFRNEADAFRVLVMVIAAGAAVIAAALLIGSTAGFILALILLAIGAWRAWGLLQTWRRRGSEPARKPAGR